ncbi:MAG TPA: amino acid adenylation domain-containing protein [Gemmatimonadaceae bacterium]|nr:amino acid adenylation domain-containing protein [Gemmatimonadaceae bacterium]
MGTKLHAFFERAVTRWPDAVAVDVPPGRGRPHRRRVTYAELDRLAEHVASALQPYVRGECIVAIVLPRDGEALYAAQLGVLKVGAAHTCIDPAYPDERIAALLADCGAVAVLTDTAGRERVHAPGVAPVIDLGTLSETHVRPALERSPPAWLAPSSLAYVIYTSGTTGMPKGTLIEHRSIANLVASDLVEFGLGPGDRVAQNSSAVYDSSVEETWLALASGATLVVMDDDAVRLGPDLPGWLRREKITVFCPTPTMLRAAGCRDPGAELPALRLVYVGGEAMPRDLADRWARGRRLENGYGPTECAVTALRTRLAPGTEVSIGVPIPGNAAWVLDEQLNDVPDGEIGELCIGGAGIARGYHDRPELTAERFPLHPRLGRIYRTGDRAHRGADGAFHYHGRLDSQVKLRGQRVELEEVESQLARCDGVREAACAVQGGDSVPALLAWIVPDRHDAPPHEETLRDALRRVLPAHMVPVRIGITAALPRTAGGKLDRRALVSRAGQDTGAATTMVPPRGATEERIAARIAEALGNGRPVSVTDDFFMDLGGDSLSAAVAISLLRDDPATAFLTVRDVYEQRTVERLAATVARHEGYATSGGSDDSGAPEPPPRSSTQDVSIPRRAVLFQGAWLLKDLVGASLLSYVAIFHAAPALAARLGATASVLLLPPLALLGLVLWAALATAMAVQVKRRLIGRYRPMRVPVWGAFYLRHWVVQRSVGLIPWWLLQGTEYQAIVLRALGARIGERVHIHRGVELEVGGWDLLEIGDDVTLAQNAAVRLVELESREMIVGPVTIGTGSTLDVQSGVHVHSVVEPGGYLCAHSSLPRGGRIPRGERWDGIPARPSGMSPAAPAVQARALSPLAMGNVLLLARLALVMLVALPAELLALGFWRLYGEEVARTGSAALVDLRMLLGASLIAAAAIVSTLAMEALACRAMGRVREGVVGRWSTGYVRIWLKPGLVDSAQRWLYGTLVWPWWLRLAGARVGPGCEISSLIDALPETLEFGAGTFCADGIYAGGAQVHRGTVMVKGTALGAGCFVGNGALLPAGCRLPERTLLGINTVAPVERLRPGAAWFGHPPFELPRRQVIRAAAGLTEHPSAVRYATRVTWELLRFSLVLVPTLAVLLYFEVIQRAESSLGWPWLFVVVPLVTAGTALMPVAAAIASKWVLLGRVRPGVHPLWSCWNGRWDFFCVVWNVYVGDISGTLRGTPLLAALLRTVGVRVGRGVVIGGAFAEDLPDPDMLTIEDGATVEGGFQAHTFEDRVLKNGPVVVRAGATIAHDAMLLYGADIGAGARVAPHSVVMKNEHLLPDTAYEGFPIHDTPPAGRS